MRQLRYIPKDPVLGGGAKRIAARGARQLAVAANRIASDGEAILFFGFASVVSA
jgi:hypothetical protein